MATMRLSVGWERLLLQLDALYGHMCLRDPPCQTVSDVLAKDLETHVIVLLKSDVSTEWFLSDVLHGIVLCSFRGDLLRDTDRVVQVARDVSSFVSSVVAPRTVSEEVFDDHLFRVTVHTAERSLCEALLQSLALCNNGAVDNEPDPADAVVDAVRLLKDLQLAAQRVFAIAAAKLEFLLERERFVNRDTRRYAERVMTRAKRFVGAADSATVDAVSRRLPHEDHLPLRTRSSATLLLTAAAAKREGDAGVRALQKQRSVASTREGKRARDELAEAVPFTANLDAAQATAPLAASTSTSEGLNGATAVRVLGIRAATPSATTAPGGNGTRTPQQLPPPLLRVTGDTPLAKAPCPVFDARRADEYSDNNDNESAGMELAGGASAAVGPHRAKRALIATDGGHASELFAAGDLPVPQPVPSSTPLPSTASQPVSGEHHGSGVGNDVRDVSALSASGIPSLLERSMAADARALMSDARLAASGSDPLCDARGGDDDKVNSSAAQQPPTSVPQSTAAPQKRQYFMVPKPKSSRSGMTTGAGGPLFLPVELRGFFDL